MILKYPLLRHKKWKMIIERGISEWSSTLKEAVNGRLHPLPHSCDKVTCIMQDSREKIVRALYRVM